MSFKMKTLGLVLVLSSAALPASTQEIDATADALTVCWFAATDSLGSDWAVK